MSDGRGDAVSLAKVLSEVRWVMQRMGEDHHPPDGAGYNAGYNEGHEGGTDYEDGDDEEEEEEILDVGGQDDGESVGWAESLRGNQGEGGKGHVGGVIEIAKPNLDVVPDPAPAAAGLTINPGPAVAGDDEDSHKGDARLDNAAAESTEALAEAPKPKPKPKARSKRKRLTRCKKKRKSSVSVEAASEKAATEKAEAEKAATTAAPTVEGGQDSTGTTLASSSAGRRRPKRATAAAAEAAGWEFREEFSEEEEEEEVGRRSGGRGRASRGKGGYAAGRASTEERVGAAMLESDDDEMGVADCIKPGCESDGVLVLCDNCSAAVHLECAEPPMVEVPAEFYLCQKCRGICSICLDKSKRDTDVRCYHCYRLFHSSCLDRVPDPDYFHWMCSSCVESDDLKVETILHCRMHKPMDTDVRLRRINAFRAKKGFEPLKSEQLRNVESPCRGREYFVRWEGKAYWHCTWLVPYLLQKKSPTKLNNFVKKTKGALTAFPQSVDQVLLTEFKPRCTSPHRVIDRQTKCMDGVTQDNVYLVKWRGLEYEECTWEMEGDLEGHMHLVQAFLDREKYGPTKEMLGNLHPPEDWDHKTPLPKPTRFELLTEQPWGLHQGPMYPYQLEGLNFVRQSWWSKTNVILADEMGLGKTIQTIAFIRSTLLERPPGDHRPCIVICPLSTTDNWEREMELWCPELNCVRFVGNIKSRTVLLEHELFQDNTSGQKAGSVQWEDTASSPSARTRKGKGKQRAGAAGKGGIVRAGVPKFHVLITHYEMLLQCAHILKAIKWELLIVDEAHRLKAGATSKVCQQTASLDTRHRLLLTGTPLQNTVDELFNLLQFIEPEKFYDKSLFLSQFTNLEREGQVAQLQKLLKPHMLRRMKKDVPDINIPDKREMVVPVELSSEQKEVYRAILTKNMDVLRKGDKNKGTSKGLQNIVMQLKKACNHPYLCRPRDHASVEDLIKASGKLQLLDSMLKKLKAAGHRVLVFSQMTALLDILQDYASFRGWLSRRIDGNTPATDRQRYIDDFNQSASGAAKEKPKGNEGKDKASCGEDKKDDDDEGEDRGKEGGIGEEGTDKGGGGNAKNIFLFFLSTKAGGQGINLATADTVIIYDSDWNPHNDLQALARAHRIGQANKVMIYRFVSRATVEERILEVAKKKLLLEHVVVQDGNKSMTQEQLNLVIKYGAEDLFREDSDDSQDQAAQQDQAVGGGESDKQTQAEKWGDGSNRGRKMLQWTEEAVDQLLDRSAVPEEERTAGGADEEKENALGSLLQTFKVASFAQVEAPAEEGHEGTGYAELGGAEASEGGGNTAELAAGADDDAMLPSGPALFGERPADSGAGWEDILAKSYKKHQMNQMKQEAELGRGKREKTQVRPFAADEDAPTPATDQEEDEDEGHPEDAGDSDPEQQQQQASADEEFEMPATKSSAPTGAEGGGGGGGGGGVTTTAGKKRNRHRDGPIEVLESTEGIKTVIRCVTRFGVPGGDWRPVMQAVVTNSKLHLDPAIADDIGPALPFLQNALKKALEPTYPHAAGRRRELLSRIAAMELIYRKLEECRGKPFDIQDKLCGAYIKQSRGQAMQQRWTRENDRSLLIGYLKHGAGRFQAMIQDDTLGLRPALEVALENVGGTSWQQLARDENGSTGQPVFKTNPESKFVKERLATLEKALVDEYQYRTGKATLESELKTMLDKHQKSLDPNDKRIEMLMARVKATQEREVPELLRRLAAVDAFHSAGEEVTMMRRRQEDARRRLADAFSAMSAYIQRYRCQESEFDLGAALMNPMADCIAEVQDKHSAVRRLHQENKALDMEFDATLRRYVVSVNDYMHNHGQMSRSNGGGAAGMASNGLSLSQRREHPSQVIDLVGASGSESPREHSYRPSMSHGVSGGVVNHGAATMGTHQPTNFAAAGPQGWSSQRHHQQHQLAARGGGAATMVTQPPLAPALQQTLHRKHASVSGSSSGGGGNSGGLPFVDTPIPAEIGGLSNGRGGGGAGARQSRGARSASGSPRGMLFSATSAAGVSGASATGSSAHFVGSGDHHQQQQVQVKEGVGVDEEESEGVQQVRHLLRVRQAILGGGDAGLVPGGGGVGDGDSARVSEPRGPGGDVGINFGREGAMQDDLAGVSSGAGGDPNDSALSAAGLTDFNDEQKPGMSRASTPVPPTTDLTSADSAAAAAEEAPAAETAPISDGGMGWESSLSGADGTASAAAALDEEFWATDAGDDGDIGGGGSGERRDGGVGVEHSNMPANDGMAGNLPGDGVVDDDPGADALNDGLWGFDDGNEDRDGGAAEHLQKKPRVE